MKTNKMKLLNKKFGIFYETVPDHSLGGHKHILYDSNKKFFSYASYDETLEKIKKCDSIKLIIYHLCERLEYLSNDFALIKTKYHIESPSNEYINHFNGLFVLLKE